MTPTRHCSYLFNTRRDSVICHSATHRSTFRLSATATTTVFRKDGTIYQKAFRNCRDAFTAFLYWHTQGQAAVDCFIEAIEIDSSLHTAERLACEAVNPTWTLEKTKSDKLIYYKASKGDTVVGGLSWQDLASRL